VWSLFASEPMSGCLLALRVLVCFRLAVCVALVVRVESSHGESHSVSHTHRLTLILGHNGA